MEILINKEIIFDAIKDTFTQPAQSNEFFYTKFKRCLKENIKLLLKKHHIPLSTKNIKSTSSKYTFIQDNVFPGYSVKVEGRIFEVIKQYDIHSCIKKYGLTSVEYPCCEYLQTYEEFKNRKDKCFGNIVFSVKKDLKEPVNFKAEYPLKIVGSVNSIGKNKVKPFIAIVGIFVDFNYFDEYIKDCIAQCKCPTELLTPCLNIYENDLPIFQCQCCGRLYLCSCYEKYAPKKFNTFFHHADRYRIRNILIKPNICFLCTHTGYIKKLPNYCYDLLNLFDPNLKTNLDYFYFLKNNYNIEIAPTGYKGESDLYNIIVGIVGKDNVLIHYRPDWLEGLEIDIYIPSLKIGFEYQGQQHYEPIKFFGGEKSLLTRTEHDTRKKEICQKNNIDLYQIPFDKELYPDDILNIIVTKEGWK